MTPPTRLGDVAEVVNGRIPAKTVDTGDGPRFFGLAEISGHPLRVIEPGIDLKQATYLRAGDVVVALLGDLGASAIVDADDAGAVLGRECAAVRITAPGLLLPSWLYAWTKSQHFQDQIAGNASGTTMPRVTSRALADFSLPIPPRSTQEQLEATTHCLDVALRSTKDLIRNVEDLRQAEVDLAIGKELEAR
jgi:Type I restriction modification DNA specificity domain